MIIGEKIYELGYMRVLGGKKMVYKFNWINNCWIIEDDFFYNNGGLCI